MTILLCIERELVKTHIQTDTRTLASFEIYTSFRVHTAADKTRSRRLAANNGCVGTRRRIKFKPSLLFKPNSYFPSLPSIPKNKTLNI